MKFLITGLGSIGQRHVRNLRRVLGPNAEIGAYRVRKRDVVIDPGLTAKTGESPEAYYGLRTFSSLEEALADRPDAVFVTNPIAFHMETALAAAREGCHLFIEKPLSDRWQGVDELRHLVAEKHLVVCAGYNLRFHPALKLMRQALRENRIGRICSAQIHVGEYLPGMHPYEDYRDSHAARRREGGGVILCLSHEIDYACWLFGIPTRVFSVGGHLTGMELDVEDTAGVLCEFKIAGRSVPVQLHLDFVQRPPSRSCKIVGETGTIVWDYYGQSFSLYDASRGDWTKQTFEAFDRNTMFIDELTNFLKAIEGGPPEFASLDEGASALRVALAARSSLEERRIVELTA